MNKLSKKLKEIVKGSTFGTDPNDPWSAKANIAESGGLSEYLKSKGINPAFVSKDTKISHAKSAEFAKWKQDHQFEEVEYINEDKYLDAYLLSRGLNPKTITTDQKIAHAKSSAFLSWKKNHLHEQLAKTTPVQKKQDILDKKEKHGTPLHTEEVNGKDTVTLDIPFMIRVLEYAREDAKDDMALHKVVEKLIEIRNKGTLTMDDYNFVTSIKEEYDLTEGRMKDIVTDKEEKSRLAAHERGGADAWYGRKYSNPHEVGSIEHKAYHQGYHGGEKGGKDYGTPKGKPVHSFREASEPRMTALDKFRAGAAERAKKHDQLKAQMDVAHSQGKEDMKGAIDRLAKALNKEEVEHKVGDSVTVNSKFFGKQKGKVTKVDNQSVHVQRDGKKTSEKYPHDAVVKEDIEQIDELKKSTLDSYRGKALDSLKNAQSNKDASEDGRHMSRAFAKLHAKSSEIADKRAKGLKGYLQRKHGMKPGYDDQRKMTSEDIYQDSQAATQTNFDGANAPDNTEPQMPGLNKKREMSKSARIIKSIYNKLGMVKEELYDHEKEDKSVATYGKKPKLQQVDADKEKGETSPKAAAVLSGGKTLTGQNRDTLEIDPEMKRPIRFGNKKQ